MPKTRRTFETKSAAVRSMPNWRTMPVPELVQQIKAATGMKVTGSDVHSARKHAPKSVPRVLPKTIFADVVIDAGEVQPHARGGVDLGPAGPFIDDVATMVAFVQFAKRMGLARARETLDALDALEDALEGRSK